MVSLQTLCQQHHIWYIRRIPSTKGSLAKKISRVFCALQCQTGIISHLLPRSAAQGDDTVFAVGARIARPPREAVFRDGKGVVQGRFLRRTQRPPCVTGPQESAACGGCGDLKPPLGAQGARKGALPVAGQATAAVGQPLALADRNAGREGLVATRRCHGISHDGGDQSFRSLPVLCTPVSGPSPAVYNPSGTASPCHLPLHRGRALATAFDESALTAQLTDNTSQALRASSPQGEPWAISFGESSQAPPPSGRAMRAPTVGIAASASNQAKKSPRRTGGILIRGSCDLRIRD